jgi:signal transduction protein with GAF and PtsI domain
MTQKIESLNGEVSQEESTRSYGFLFQLLGASNFLEQQSNIEIGLKDLASMTAQILDAQKCSIMLLETGITDKNEHQKKEPYLKVFTHYGHLPKDAYEQITKLNEGIAGHVAATGECLLVKDISKSSFIKVARYGENQNKSLVSAPIFITNKVIGVINISDKNNNQVFQEQDLELLKTFALFVGKSIHIVELQNILQSRFIEIAVAKEVEKRGNKISNISPDPARISKIVAKAIFKELNQGGFGPNQIINITTEILNLLQKQMNHVH